MIEVTENVVSFMKLHKKEIELSFVKNFPDVCQP